MKNIKKSVYSLFVAIIVYAIISCGIGSSSQSSRGLNLKIWIGKDKYCLDEDIQVKVVLTNEGKNDVLVDEHWAILPGIWPPKMSSGALTVSDSSGNSLPIYVKITRPSVAKEDFVIFKPGQTLEKNVILRNTRLGEPFTYDYPFQVGETYTVNVIYQNVLLASIDANGKEIDSWTGKISASDTFQISSNACKN